MYHKDTGSKTFGEHYSKSMRHQNFHKRRYIKICYINVFLKNDYGKDRKSIENGKKKIYSETGQAISAVP